MVYRVFLSSTSKDLTDYREAVLAAIGGMDGFAPIAMENFGARAAAAVDFDDRKMGESHVLVGLLGLCYGSSPRDGPPSFTEREYDSAHATGIDRLMLVSPDDFPVPGHLIEPDAQRKHQQEFRARVKADLIVDASDAAFASPAALASAVTRALANWRADRESAERERAGSARPRSARDENAQSDGRGESSEGTSSSQADPISTTNAKDRGHAGFLLKLYQVREYISEDTRKYIERRVITDWYEGEISK